MSLFSFLLSFVLIFNAFFSRLFIKHNKKNENNKIIQQQQSKCPKETQKTDEKTLTKSTGVHIGKKATNTLTCKLAIPSFISPTQRHSCQMIEIYYKIEIRLNARFYRIIRIHPSLTLPITIAVKSKTTDDEWIDDDDRYTQTYTISLWKKQMEWKKKSKARWS